MKTFKQFVENFKPEHFPWRSNKVKADHDLTYACQEAVARKIKEHGKQPAKKIALNKLHATREDFNDDHPNELGKHLVFPEHKHHPVIARFTDRYHKTTHLILDGHHRCAKAINNKKTHIKAHVYDLKDHEL